ncbi:CRISPR-associated endonuclease Cas3'' [Streptomyces tateyamensis]|uniref:CRISPR-associated endonuclease Cas3 n=1 Tax=Streptomyces tateyamensis TaxID=565073 RepID=A0A2V4NN76_9ACTN|nr:CRISPR-associated endonuclease Cas3'' [Streptomyces tateyamensis]PYC87660.1 CRISPR-associated endonuclease Cas3'' [Streptomyces tateyamensis]
MTAELETFVTFMRTATGHTPRPYQAQLAAEGLPALLRVPTGGGKTAAAVLPWLYRRLVAAPAGTPRRLVLALPRESVADQAFERIGEWLDRLGLSGGEVGLHLLAGGAAQDGGWRRNPERTAILVGTHDVLLSRALMRGHADWRPMAPVSYGLLHNDAQWVFDELELLGPALPTTRRLQELRDRWGTAAPTATMWMTSTSSAAELGPERVGAGGLATRRRLTRLHPAPERYEGALAEAVAAAHLPGTRTLVVLNTLARARAVHAALAAAGTEALLLHPHYREADRRRLLAAATAEHDLDLVLVATPVVEAALDLSSRTLVTELAPWASLVQRAGRCNRYGEHPEGGELLWCTPPEGGDPSVERWLTARDGRSVTPAELLAAEPGAPEPALAPTAPPTPDELRALFDTADQSSADQSTADQGSADLGTPGDATATVGTSVGTADRWLAAPAQLTALVAWRSWADGRPAEDEPDPSSAELCAVPLGELAELPAGRAWLRDPLDARWRPALPAELAPGARLVLDARHGGYLPTLGWTPLSRTPVVPEPAPPQRPAYACTAWVSLDQHLQETEQEARLLLAALPALPSEQHEAVARAARYHDLGKCHDAFQDKLRAGRTDPPDGLLAKSKNGAEPLPPYLSPRPHLRHELVSALLLWQGGHDPLVTYLAAAHHGHVRITVRPRPGEAPGLLLGVADGDRTPPVELSSGERFPAQQLDTSDFPAPWTERARTLRDHPELGPFRLAFLETLVRVADWRASARHDGPLPSAGG